MRTPYTFEDLMNIEYFRSIIFLTMLYGGDKGLRPEDYRYILVKNHDGIKKTDIINKWKNKFKKTKDLRYTFIYLIRIGCISSKTNLSNKLGNLVNLYNVLEKKTIDQIPYYKIRKDCWYKPWKLHLKGIIDRIPDKYIYDITNDFIKNYRSKLVADKVSNEDILKLFNY